MGGTPKVSVIIPVYNAEKYLRQCLDSVMGQTLREIEIICVDDGSTDGSVAILQEYAEKDSRVQVLQQKNQFAGVARNNGMAAAKGEYYVFLDADDFFEPDLLRLQYEQCEKYQADISLCGADKYDVRENAFIPTPWLLNLRNFPKNSPFSREDVCSNIFRLTTPVPWNKMFSAQFVKNNNIKFQGLSRANDVFFVWTALTLASRIVYVDEVLVHYRVGMSTNLQANNKRSPLDFCMALSAVKERLIRENIFDEVKDGFVNDAMGQCEYNLRSLGDARSPQFRYLAAQIKENYLEEFEIAEYPAERFYDRKRYQHFLSQLQFTETPKVSVIIPVYNVEKYLPQCMDSVVNQTLREIEIICVNDGSTDNSAAILKDYCTKDFRIKVIQQYHVGVSCARNTGIRAARGEYIYFLDSDDFIEENSLEFLHQEAKQNELDVLLFDGESFYEPPEYKKNFPGMDCCYRPCEFGGVYSGPELYAKMREKNVFRPMVWLQFIRRQYLMDEKITFREGILHEDILFAIYCILQAKRVSHRKVSLNHYRRRGGTITGSEVTFERVYGKYVTLVELAAYMNTRKFNDVVNLHMAGYMKWLFGVMVKEFQTLPERELEKTRYLSATDQVWLDLLNHCESKVSEPKTPENPQKAVPRMIVSLTSYPARIAHVGTALRSLLNQTMPADMVILWLSLEQFPNRDADLPKELLELTKQGLTICWCEGDIKSHKKYYYAMLEYPDDIIITADDDLIYYPDTIEDLYKSYQKFPHCVSAVRCHRITFRQDGMVDKYENWKMRWSKQIGVPSMDLFSTSGAGTLYPPHCMHPELFNLSAIQKYCIHADDIWLKIMQVMNHTPTVLARPDRPLRQIENSQEEALWYTNVREGRNDKQLFAILNRYNQYYGPADTLLARMRGDTNLYVLNSDAGSGYKAEIGNVVRNSYFNENLYKEHIHELETEIRNIHASASYRIGRFITFIPRKIRGGIRCYQEHGWRYTVQRVKEKLMAVLK